MRGGIISVGNKDFEMPAYESLEPRREAVLFENLVSRSRRMRS